MDSPDTEFQQGQWDDFDSFLDLGSYSQQEVEWTAPRTHEFEWTPLEATTQDSGAVDESSKQATENDGTTLRDKATEDGGHEAPTTKMKRAKRPKGQARNKAEDLEVRATSPLLSNLSLRFGKAKESSSTRSATGLPPAKRSHCRVTTGGSHKASCDASEVAGAV